MSPADVKVTQAWIADLDRWARESAATCVLAKPLQGMAVEQVRAMLAAVEQAAFDATREAAARIAADFFELSPLANIAVPIRALTLADVLPKEKPNADQAQG
jgi:hypothetical protein